MRRSTKDDAYDWFGALSAASEQARELRPGPSLGPKARCLCGSDDTRDGTRLTPIDLTTADVTAQRNEGIRPCQACHHGIQHGAMHIVRYHHATTNVRDHFHPSCVQI